jgi:hypothetical protein
MWVLVVPVYTAPARVRVILKVSAYNPPETITEHAPVVHFGVNCHVSVSVPPTLRFPPVVWTTFMSTVHHPVKRPAETGGGRVVTGRTEDGAERTPPDTATTLYTYSVMGTSPPSW